MVGHGGTRGASDWSWSILPLEYYGGWVPSPSRCGRMTVGDSVAWARRGLSDRFGHARLLIEDDQTIADFVARGLRESGSPWTRPPTDNPASIRPGTPYDVAIVDLMLPKMDGLAVIDTLRKRGRPFRC